MKIDWSSCPGVERIPGKVSGAWLFKGTRLPVSVLFGNLAAGATLDEIVEWYGGVTKGELEAVLEYVADTFASPDYPKLKAQAGVPPMVAA